MKRFLLFNSPIYELKEKEEYIPPLGLGYIATYLDMAKIDVELIDCVKEGLSANDVISSINRRKPDYIGINIFTPNYHIVRNIVEHIETDCVCFIGGQVVGSIYNDILQWNFSGRLNIIIGEGEMIIPQIVLDKCRQDPEKQIDSKFVYRVNKNSAYFPKNISDIYLNRKYLRDEVVVNHYGEKEISVITSRGCVFNCAFCGGARCLNQDVMPRTRTEESVIREINEIMCAYPDVQSIRILDDLFLRDAKSIDMANNIFGHFPQLSWRGMAHVLSLAAACDKIKELRAGKCKELFIGIESGSETVRKRINKLGSRNDIIRVSREILQNGIDLKGYFIYGFPKETKEDFQKTFELAAELKEMSLNLPGSFRTSVFQFRPYHGTQLYNEIIEESGSIHEYRLNESISCFEGRTQFNVVSGNYSMESDELLNEYIIKTQELTKEKL